MKIILRLILIFLGFFSLGGGMFRIFFIVWRGGLLKNGGFLLIIFIIIILRDYMLIYKDYLVENKYRNFKGKNFIC